MDATTPQTETQSAAALPTLMAVMFINVLGFGIVVPLLPFYAKSFQAPAWQIALIFSAYSIGAFFGEPFWGRLSDRIGRKPILVSSVCGNCLCYLALAFAPNVYIAFLVRLLGGLTSGNGSVVQGYIADVTGPDERTRRMSQLSAAFNFGFIVGPAIGGLLANPAAGHAGFRTPLLCASALSALCAAGLFLFLKESRARRPRFEAQPGRFAALWEALTHPTINRLMLVTFLGGSAFMGIESIFGLWTQARFHWGPHEIGYTFAATGIVATACQLRIVGPLSERFGQAEMLAIGMGLSAICLGLQPLMPTGSAIVGLLCLSAIGQSVAWPNVSALISRNVSWQNQGQFLGLNNATSSLARVVGPFMLGILFSNAGVDVPFYVAGLMVLPAMLFAWQARQAGADFSESELSAGE
jgi:DHA1 family tetracycline resistance protein-like MFS transporter